MHLSGSIPGGGRARSLSRMLSTARLDAPHTRTFRAGLMLSGMFFPRGNRICRIISMRVWVFPVPVRDGQTQTYFHALSVPGGP